MAKCDLCGVECEDRAFPDVPFCEDCHLFFYHNIERPMDKSRSEERKQDAQRTDEKRPAWHAKIFGGMRA